MIGRLGKFRLRLGRGRTSNLVIIPFFFMHLVDTPELA